MQTKLPVFQLREALLQFLHLLMNCLARSKREYVGKLVFVDCIRVIIIDSLPFCLDSVKFIVKHFRYLSHK